MWGVDSRCVFVFSRELEQTDFVAAMFAGGVHITWRASLGRVGVGVTCFFGKGDVLV